MTSRDLTARQADALKQQIRLRLQYLNRLCDRLDYLHFEPTDLLAQEALRARDAMQGLFVAAHYASCERGVGRPSNE